MTEKLQNNFEYRNGLLGLCAVGDYHLIMVNQSHSVHLFSVSETALMLLSNSDLKLAYAMYPRSDRYGHIFVPHYDGVAVIRIVDKLRLHVDRILTGGGKLSPAYGVAVVNDTTLCVTVWQGDNEGAYLLDMITDTVLTALQPHGAYDDYPMGGVAVSSGAKLENYDERYLVLYSPGETAGTRLDIMGMVSTRGMIVDPAGRFLVADSSSNTVWILSMTGEVLARVKSDNPSDVTLSSDNGKLYIGNGDTGHITVFQ